MKKFNKAITEAIKAFFKNEIVLQTIVVLLHIVMIVCIWWLIADVLFIFD